MSCETMTGSIEGPDSVPDRSSMCVSDRVALVPSRLAAIVPSGGEGRADREANRMSRASMSSPKTSPTGCCSRRGSSRKMDIKNNKVGRNTRGGEKRQAG